MFTTFKYFYGFVFKKIGWFIVFMTVGTIAVGLDLITPYFFKLFVESLEKGDLQELLRLILIFASVQFIALVLHNLKWILNDKTAIDVSMDIKSTIFKYVQDLDFVFHSNKSTGSLISAFKRGEKAFWGMFEKIHVRAWEIVVGIGVMIYFFQDINPLFITIFMISFALTLIATKILAGKNIKTREVFNEWDDKITNITTDNFINFETVKMFAKEDWELSRLKNTFVNWKITLWRHFWTYRMIDMTIGTLVITSIAAVLFLSGDLIGKGEISVGDFVLVASYINIFFPKLFDLIYSLREISIDYADIKKYFGLLDYDIEIKDPVNPIFKENTLGEIEFKNVSHSYKEGTKNAVKDFNLTIKQGESVAFVGRSGSGKTTITKLLMRFFDPEKGKILIDGIDIKNFTKTNLRNFFGVVPQEAVLFNNTIGYNIGYGAGQELKNTDVKQAAKLANIADFIESLPKAYETNVGERGIKLSGGQKQRLAIARMIISNPDIIIFDEATSHLDSESERLIQDAFWKYANDKTTIIIAHRLSTISKADRIVVMEKGKIKEIGTHKDLLENNKSLYKYLWNLQGEK